MQNVIKVALASIAILVVSAGFLALGGGALSRGFFYLSKYSALPVRQQESPVFFYVYVAFMLFWGVLLLAASAAVAFSRGEFRNDIISFVDSVLLSTPAPRWSFIVLAVLFAALVLVCIPLFFL